MKTKLIIDGNTVYELDEECLQCRKQERQGDGAQEKQNREWKFTMDSGQKSEKS